MSGIRIKDHVTRKHSMFVGRSEFRFRMVGEVVGSRFRTVTPGEAQVEQVLVKFQRLTGWWEESWIRADLLRVYTGPEKRLAPVTAKQIETKLEELKTPKTIEFQGHERYAVLPDPVFDMRGEYNSYVTIHSSTSRTVFRTKERAEACAEAALARTGEPHVVVKFVSRFNKPPMPKVIKEIYQ